MVHGVGHHDRLSSLMEVYQALRANLHSNEAPALFEDSIPDWQLERFEEGGNPSYLKLRFRFRAVPGDTAVVYLYEVNYSDLAQVIRRNHRLDLTTLFVGLDVAVCWARQQLPGDLQTIFPGDPRALATSLQRVSGVMAAATGPLLGIPSLALKRYYGRSFLAAFTRFFEDVATYALDKNGEQLISEHLDRVVDNILESGRFKNPGDAARSEFVMAAHSLGSVVTHSYLVRHQEDGKLPDRVVTFGSPIGLITWLWMFLDFFDFDFSRWRGKKTFFCWKPLVNKSVSRKPFTWINVINCLDPIASCFPDAVSDLSRSPDDLTAALGGGITHLYFGRAELSAAGRAHTEYIHDRLGFMEVLQRACGLRLGDPRDVTTRERTTHWRMTIALLRRLRVVCWFAAMMCAVIYCAIIAWHFNNWMLIGTALLFSVPAFAISGQAFIQRLFFGGQTKRISADVIRQLHWDAPALPYRVRLWLGDCRRAIAGAPRDAAHLSTGGTWAQTFNKLFAFAASIAVMLVPAAIGWSVTGPPTRHMAWGLYVLPLVVFSLYLIACAVYELVSAWRAVIDHLGIASDDEASGTPSTRATRPSSSSS
jgi:hypothetical protein